MAQTALSREASSVFTVMCVFLMVVARGKAYDFRVGGPKGTWMVPADPNTPIYNQWAEKSRFQINDSILFVYDGNHDSVLRVTKDDYENCKTAGALDKFTDGHSVYKFTQSGPHYFISGVAENCHKNEKLVVVVMADRSNRTAAAPAPQVSPPSPAPAGQEPPSPPPASPPSETNEAPTPTPPADSSPHKNGASGVIGNGVVGIVIAAVIGVSIHHLF